MSFHLERGKIVGIQSISVVVVSQQINQVVQKEVAEIYFYMAL